MFLEPSVFHCDSFAKYAVAFFGIHAPARSAVAAFEVGGPRLRVVRLEPCRWSGSPV
jgi:hypothetical protein